MTGGNNKTGGRRSFGKGRRSVQGQQNTPRFYGATAALKGVMFDTGVDRQAETYIKNLKRIADYVGANMKHHGADVRFVVENLADPMFEEPEDPADDANENAITDVGKAGRLLHQASRNAEREQEDTILDHPWTMHGRHEVQVGG